MEFYVVIWNTRDMAAGEEGMDRQPGRRSFTDLLRETDASLIVNLNNAFADVRAWETPTTHASETPPITPTSITTTTTTRTRKNPIVRGLSFTPQEDKLLISGWLNISQDPIVGNEQSGRSYWGRMTDYYNTHKTTGSIRTQSSLSNRFAVIQAAVSKFCGCYAQIESMHRSGVTENDKLENVRTLYTEFTKTQFHFEHRWVLLRYEQKWTHALELHKQKGRKTPNSRASTTESVNLEDGVSQSSFVDADERPIGRKAEKARLSKRKSPQEDNGEIKTILRDIQQTKLKMHDDRMELQNKQYQQNDERLAQGTERLAHEAQRLIQETERLAQEKARNEIEQRKEDERILNIDTTSMPSHLAVWYQLKQKEILKKNGLV